MLANLANCWLCIHNTIGYIMHSTCLNAPFACRDYNKSRQYCNQALKSFQEQKVGHVAWDRCFHGFDCLVKLCTAMMMAGACCPTQLAVQPKFALDDETAQQRRKRHEMQTHLESWSQLKPSYIVSRYTIYRL